jgi:hypothetical protein
MRSRGATEGGLSTPAETTPEESEARAVEISARGTRRVLESVYLELQELARQHGLTVEYRLSLEHPGDPGSEHQAGSGTIGAGAKARIPSSE